MLLAILFLFHSSCALESAPSGRYSLAQTIFGFRKERIIALDSPQESAKLLNKDFLCCPTSLRHEGTGSVLLLTRA